MRFVSNLPGLGLGTAMREKFVLALDGQRDYLPDTKTGWTGSLPVAFSQTGLSQADIDFALSYWPEKSFRGRWLEADEVTMQPLTERIGMYDTDEQAAAQGWPDEIKQLVEAWMVAKDNYGIDFVEVEHAAQVAAAGKPWPSYDDTHHFKIPPLAQELGLIAETLAWEEANKNRDGVTSKLHEMLNKPAVVEADEVVAA